MKNLQASDNDDANKIVGQAAKEKDKKRNFNFLMDLATTPMVAEDKVFSR